MRIATVASSIAVFYELGRFRFDEQLQSERPRAEHLAEDAERDDGEVVL